MRRGSTDSVTSFEGLSFEQPPVHSRRESLSMAPDDDEGAADDVEPAVKLRRGRSRRDSVKRRRSLVEQLQLQFSDAGGDSDHEHGGEGEGAADKPAAGEAEPPPSSPARGGGAVEQQSDDEFDETRAPQVKPSSRGGSTGKVNLLARNVRGKSKRSSEGSAPKMSPLSPGGKMSKLQPRKSEYPWRDASDSDDEPEQTVGGGGASLTVA